MQAVGLSHTGLVRDNNEDAYYIDCQRGLLMVADGMGGHVGGEVASKLAVEAAVSALATGWQQPEQALRRAFAAANQAVWLGAADPALAGMGTTLTVAALLDEEIIIGHVGDSRAYLVCADAIHCLTSDHSVSGQLLAAGKITAAEAASHPQRHVLTRALGTSREIEVEIRRHRQVCGHLLLCSDGLTEVVTAQEILVQVNCSAGLIQRVEQLVALALERGGPDNVTVVLAAI